MQPDLLPWYPCFVRKTHWNIIQFQLFDIFQQSLQNFGPIAVQASPGREGEKAASQLI